MENVLEYGFNETIGHRIGKCSLTLGKKMNSNGTNLSHIPKPLICIYANQNRNELQLD